MDQIRFAVARLDAHGRPVRALMVRVARAGCGELANATMRAAVPCGHAAECVAMMTNLRAREIRKPVDEKCDIAIEQRRPAQARSRSTEQRQAGGLAGRRPRSMTASSRSRPIDHKRAPSPWLMAVRCIASQHAARFAVLVGRRRLLVSTQRRCETHENLRRFNVVHRRYLQIKRRRRCLTRAQ